MLWVLSTAAGQAEASTVTAALLLSVGEGPGQVEDLEASWAFRGDARLPKTRLRVPAFVSSAGALFLQLSSHVCRSSLKPVH